MNEILSDLEIANGLKMRDIRIYEQCICKYRNYIGAVVIQKIGSSLEKEDIEEIVSDVFFAIWKNADKITLEKGSIRAYFAAIARNMAVNKLRERQKLSVTSIENYPTEHFSHNTAGSASDSNPEAILLRQEYAQQIQSEINRFKSPDKELFLQYHYDGVPIKDLSNTFGLKETTIKSKLLRCRKKLSEKLKIEWRESL